MKSVWYLDINVDNVRHLIAVNELPEEWKTLEGTKIYLFTKVENEVYSGVTTIRYGDWVTEEELDHIVMAYVEFSIYKLHATPTIIL